MPLRHKNIFLLLLPVFLYACSSGGGESPGDSDTGQSSSRSVSSNASSNVSSSASSIIASSSSSLVTSSSSSTQSSSPSSESSSTSEQSSESSSIIPVSSASSSSEENSSSISSVSSSQSDSSSSVSSSTSSSISSTLSTSSSNSSSEESSSESSSSETSSSSSETASSSSENSSSSSASDFYSTNIEAPIVQGICSSCHNSNGISAGTRLVFTVGNDESVNNYGVFETFVAEVDDPVNYLLNKATGISHGGGSQLSASSQEYEDLETFLNSLTGGSSSSEPVESFYKDLSIEPNEATLRRAAILFAGRTPTDEELTSASGTESNLKATIKQLMTGDNFHQFLLRGANDRLLTDAFIDARFLEVVDNNTPFYPELANRRYDAYGSDQDTIDEFETWMRKLRYGITRAPLELIAYVVENDRPYYEILTADYTMVNPQTNVIYNASLSFDSDEPTEFKVGYNRGQILLDENYDGEFVVNRGTNIFSHGDFVEYPHTGILNEPVFLNRYPSTDTNRNRARSRWTYYHFLDVDIEKSATRTTDPDALADTNNPTMNNPNCTVCHQVMDPVAGAYQNYGDEGRYRNSWGGNDALPDTYKWADGSEYQVGDTWYRDMRSPGFNGDTAPSQTNSLQWLAQQIVNDERFAKATVKFWWTAVMSDELIAAPENSDDQNYNAQLSAYQAQSVLIDQLAENFINGFDGGAPYDLKDLLTEMVTSDWFRINGTDAELSSDRENAVAQVGAGRLLTALELEAKSAFLLGFAWGEGEAPWRADNRWSNLANRYRIYYGGIDSDGITERARSLNSLMSSVALAQATSVSCPAVILDFNRDEADRRIFKYVDRYTIPDLEARQQVPVLVNSDEGEGIQVLSQAINSGDIRIRLSFDNPFWDSETETSTQLIIHQILVSNNSGSVILDINGEDFSSTEGVEFSLNESGNPTGSRYWNETLEEFTGWQLWQGYIDIPLTISSSDTYQIDIRASRQNLPSNLVKLGISILSDNENVSANGEQALKQQLQFIHQAFLGESLEMDDTELLSSYDLLLELRDQRIARNFPRNGIAWGEESCEFPEDGWWNQNRNEDLADLEFMQGAWADLLVYILTDYRYLHE